MHSTTRRSTIKARARADEAVEYRHWACGHDSQTLDLLLPLLVGCRSLKMSFDQLDRTTRYIADAKARASALLSEKAPKLTALEKAMWLKLKRAEPPSK